MRYQLDLGTITYWAGGFDRTPGEPHSAVGRVQGSWKRLDRLPEVIAQGPPPRILFFQQANWFDLNGSELLHYTERLLRPFGRYRGFLTPNDWNVCHTVTFIREPHAGEPDIDVLHHWDGKDIGEEQDRVGFTEVQIDNGPVLWLRGVMLYPRSGERRLEQAKAIAGAVPDGVKALIAGSFNSALSGPQEPMRDWHTFARIFPHKLLHKGMLREDGQIVADTRTLDHFCGRWSTAANRRLGGCGWFNLGDLDGDYTPTTHSEQHKGGQMRINHVLTNWADALVPGSHVTHPILHNAAKKHRYITVSVHI